MKIIYLILVLFTAVPIYGQACCTAGTPLLGSLEMSTNQKGVWQFGLSYQFNSLEDVYSGSSEFIDRSRKRTTQAYLLESSYGLTNDFTITTLLSFVNQSRIINPINAASSELISRGIGDAVVLLKYNIIQLSMFNQQELAVGSGVKIPMGKSNIKSMGILIPADMQPGTGSWDGILWGYYSKNNLINLPLNIFINSTYRFNGTNKRFGENNEGYKFGNESITSFGLGYRTDLRLDFTLLVRYRYTSADEFAFVEIPNTGGNWLYAVPGINISIFDSFSLRLTGEIPFYRNLKGTQLTTTFTTSASVFYSFGSIDSLLEF